MGDIMKQAIQTDKAPTAIGPYSQAIKSSSGTVIYCSGQIPLDPSTMEIVGSNATEQCNQVMNNLKAVLTEAGAELNNIVKTTIYLSDMNDFTAVNEVYGSFFTGTPPARATVEVSRLPKDVTIEIDCIAVID